MIMDLQNKKIMAFRKVSDGMQIQPSVNRTALQQCWSESLFTINNSSEKERSSSIDPSPHLSPYGQDTAHFSPSDTTSPSLFSNFFVSPPSSPSMTSTHSLLPFSFQPTQTPIQMQPKITTITTTTSSSSSLPSLSSLSSVSSLTPTTLTGSPSLLSQTPTMTLKTNSDSWNDNLSMLQSSLTQLSQHSLFGVLRDVHDFFTARYIQPPSVSDETRSVSFRNNDKAIPFSLELLCTNLAIPFAEFRVSLPYWLAKHSIDFDLNSVDDPLKNSLYELHSQFLSHVSEAEQQFLDLAQKIYQLEELFGLHTFYMKVNTLRNIFLSACFHLEASLLTHMNNIESKIIPNERNGKLLTPNNSPLQKWFYTHLSNPYPTEDEKRKLVAKSGLSMKQINTWFGNIRVRYKRRLHDYIHTKQFSQETNPQTVMDTTTTNIITNNNNNNNTNQNNNNNCNSNGDQ